MKAKQTYAICFGISRYHNLSPLSYAAADARDVAEMLRGSASPTHVKLSLDAEATKESILEGLRWVAGAVSPSDTAVIFFSGHGGRRATQTNGHAYFCPVEASQEGDERSCITSDELTTALRAIKSERLVVLLDACYSGGVGEPRHRGANLSASLTDQDMSALIEGSGRIIMAASRPDELAWEEPGMRNGVFTHYLLCGLRGEAARADGTVWASDLFGYVTRRVRRHSRQHPYQKAVGEDFVLMVQRSALSLPPRVAATRALHEDGQRALRLAMRRVYNRAELSLLCYDLGFSLEDLPGTTLETQLMELIDHCHRHGLREQLLARVIADRPQIILNPQPTA
jgi:uncharacterized caspase-like protein